MNSLKIPRKEKNLKNWPALAQYIGVNWRPELCDTVQRTEARNEMIAAGQFAVLKRAMENLKKLLHMD